MKTHFPHYHTNQNSEGIQVMRSEEFPELYLIAARELYKHTELDFVKEHLRDLRAVTDWILSFISMSNPELVRSGAVCPYTENSIIQGRLLLTVFEQKQPKIEEICQIVKNYQAWYNQIIGESKSEYEALHTSIVILFPNLPKEETYDLIEGSHRQLKPHFVKNKHMIGQFYPDCEVPSVWNPDFKPMKSPIPLLVIRKMIKTDFSFLKDNRFFIETYLQTFKENGIPAKYLKEIKSRYNIELGTK
ncbi:MAG: DUF6875 domain-containing protein [Bacteroidota bacterium]